MGRRPTCSHQSLARISRPSTGWDLFQRRSVAGSACRAGLVPRQTRFPMPGMTSSGSTVGPEAQDRGGRQEGWGDRLGCHEHCCRKKGHTPTHGDQLLYPNPAPNQALAPMHVCRGGRSQVSDLWTVYKSSRGHRIQGHRTRGPRNKPSSACAGNPCVTTPGVRPGRLPCAALHRSLLETPKRSAGNPAWVRGRSGYSDGPWESENKVTPPAWCAAHDRLCVPVPQANGRQPMNWEGTFPGPSPGTAELQGRASAYT